MRTKLFIPIFFLCISGCVTTPTHKAAVVSHAAASVTRATGHATSAKKHITRAKESTQQTTEDINTGIDASKQLGDLINDLRNTL
jgi:hypothetical protein